MSNPAIANLIGARLKAGLVHPGDPERNVPSRQVALPFGMQKGMPKEMSELVDETTKMIAEAIVFLIETEGGCEIVPRDEAAEMRRAVGQQAPAPLLPVHCHCDPSNALVFLRAPVNERITIDGGSLIRTLAERDEACPHKPREQT